MSSVGGGDGREGDVSSLAFRRRHGHLVIVAGIIVVTAIFVDCYSIVATIVIGIEFAVIDDQSRCLAGECDGVVGGVVVVALMWLTLLSGGIFQSSHRSQPEYQSGMRLRKKKI